MATAGGLVFIAGTWDHHLRAFLSHNLEEPLSRLIERGGQECARAVVLGGSSNARVGVAQLGESAHAQHATGRLELTVADGGNILADQTRIEQPAEVAAGAGDDDGAHARGAVAREGATHSDRLVVGMGVHRQERSVRRHG